ncbi:coiled-coil domain-containing protein 12-like isoform X2 [Acanthaster planci]|uniref:Coiled-coil domain-containing protein 12-like isoform X2 n=1 Tax=Acanthaster planci TaxID=133434 RepID=A0A8B7XR84_ACAPL|nr:coiled-coil domain-containing protein 12-like isoform X2 [Acanthaster planci]
MQYFISHQRDTENTEPPTKKPLTDENVTEESKAVFKNYNPADDTLKEKVLPKASLPSVEEHIKDQLEAAKPVPVVEEVDLVNLAPRKPDWDLKRDITPKLEKLERRTQRAIAELIRERIQSGMASDLMTAVSAQQPPTEPRGDDSDDD